MVRSGEMPPKEKPRPDGKTVEAFLRSLDGLLADFDCTGTRNVGRVTLHRLNKSEYNNTIRDLIGVDFHPAADFPNDDVGYGFDTSAILDVALVTRTLPGGAIGDAFEQAIVNIDTPKPVKIRMPELNVAQGAGENKRGTVYHERQRVSGELSRRGDYIIRHRVRRAAKQGRNHSGVAATRTKRARRLT